MNTRRIIFSLVSLFVVAVTYSFAQVFQKLDKAYADKVISADEMILNKFYYMHDKSKVNKKYLVISTE
jgi:hypothetical protein